VSIALRCVCGQAFEQPGNGRVLVVDGGGSKRCALLGDNIADMAHKNGWSVSFWPGLLHGIVALCRTCIAAAAAASMMYDLSAMATNMLQELLVCICMLQHDADVSCTLPPLAEPAPAPAVHTLTPVCSCVSDVCFTWHTTTLQGAIIYGCIRDSEDISKMPLGVKALGTYPLKSAKRDVGLADVPVTIAGVTVEPGDWVYADKDGVLVSKEELKL
jgi:hypothetical protein